MTIKLIVTIQQDDKRTFTKIETENIDSTPYEREVELHMRTLVKDYFDEQILRYNGKSIEGEISQDMSDDFLRKNRWD
jgi:hypothetical protein